MSLFNKVTAIVASGILVLNFATIPTAHAQLPVLVPTPSPDLVRGGNLWTITAFNDASPVHTQMATQGICFEFIGVVGTHFRYRWYSTTFPDWNGIASQEGDQVFMHGDYAKDVGHDGIHWAIDTSKAGSGHWTEWREDGGFGNTIVFANAVFQRAGICRTPIPVPLPYVPNQYTIDGILIENPMGIEVKD
ncbi:MAG: hypothetical protein AUG12_00405 [Acidobacteria bacterium 13_1_20CM_2_57_8]|nr:MAG: hypothetical protein AUG12_00405 [Acidobacteria bacterium 13_1_20CM_2_57_8]PYS29798.1 MAG: hypothetical protein DMG11_07570 [Acidobacteriota bacterium]